MIHSRRFFYISLLFYTAHKEKHFSLYITGVYLTYSRNA